MASASTFNPWVLIGLASAVVTLLLFFVRTPDMFTRSGRRRVRAQRDLDLWSKLPDGPEKERVLGEIQVTLAELRRGRAVESPAPVSGGHQPTAAPPGSAPAATSAATIAHDRHRLLPGRPLDVKRTVRATAAAGVTGTLGWLFSTVEPPPGATPVGLSGHVLFTFAGAVLGAVGYAYFVRERVLRQRLDQLLETTIGTRDDELPLESSLLVQGHVADGAHPRAYPFLTGPHDAAIFTDTHLVVLRARSLRFVEVLEAGLPDASVRQIPRRDVLAVAAQEGEGATYLLIEVRSDPGGEIGVIPVQAWNPGQAYRAAQALLAWLVVSEPDGPDGSSPAPV